MSNQKRIEEVARQLMLLFRKNTTTWPQAEEESKAFLAVLPEFQTCAWVQCSERMPKSGKEVYLWRFRNGNCALSSDTCIDAIAWMEIQPYVAPESELVRDVKLCFGQYQDKFLEREAILRAIKRHEDKK